MKMAPSYRLLAAVLLITLLLTSFLVAAQPSWSSSGSPPTSTAKKFKSKTLNGENVEGIKSGSTTIFTGGQGKETDHPAWLHEAGNNWKSGGKPQIYSMDYMYEDESSDTNSASGGGGNPPTTPPKTPPKKPKKPKPKQARFKFIVLGDARGSYYFTGVYLDGGLLITNGSVFKVAAGKWHTVGTKSKVITGWKRVNATDAMFIVDRHVFRRLYHRPAPDAADPVNLTVTRIEIEPGGLDTNGNKTLLHVKPGARLYKVYIYLAAAPATQPLLVNYKTASWLPPGLNLSDARAAGEWVYALPGDPVALYSCTPPGWMASDPGDIHEALARAGGHYRDLLQRLGQPAKHQR